jgi:hypothetical protein
MNASGSDQTIVIRPGPSFFVPTRNGNLLHWKLQGGMRMCWPATLMTRGRYMEARRVAHSCLRFIIAGSRAARDASRVTLQ